MRCGTTNAASSSRCGARWASPEHMHKAFQQRRKQIVGDCIQIKTDVDVYNGRNPIAEPLQVVFNFTDDIAEAEAAEPAAHKFSPLPLNWGGLGERKGFGGKAQAYLGAGAGGTGGSLPLPGGWPAPAGS